MRLIDADELRLLIQREYNTDDSDYPTQYQFGLHYTMTAIDKAPTVEPQRIKGKWIQDSYYDERYVCDKCGEPCATYINGKPRDRFCKWCGADMRGEDDET